MPDEINPYAPPKSSVNRDDTFRGIGTPRPASFGQRLVASIIDGVITAVFIGLLAFVVTILGARMEDPFSPLNLLLNYGFPFLYTILFWNYRSATPGKMIMGLTIISTNGRKPSTGAWIGRYFGYILSALPLGLGYFWMLWDDKKQTWHDKLSNTLVING